MCVRGDFKDTKKIKIRCTFAENKMDMSKENKFCQSCGMPMKQDPQGGGTNADGSKNADYCSYCYENGAFTFNGTVLEFQEFCRQMMVKGGYSKFKAWLFTRGMKRLGRWKKS